MPLLLTVIYQVNIELTECVGLHIQVLQRLNFYLLLQSKILEFEKEYEKPKDDFDLNEQDSIVKSDNDHKNDRFANANRQDVLGRLLDRQNKNRPINKKLDFKPNFGNNNFEIPKSENNENNGDDVLGKLPWRQFDETGYISATKLKPGENKYERNKFNQEASDKLSCHRSVPDTRSPL